MTTRIQSTVEKAATVYQTMDYDLFIVHGSNREIGPHLRGIKNSMATSEFYNSQPIGVVRAGPKFRIVEGHHRFQAARDLGKPVKFVIEEAGFEDKISVLNSTRRNWGLADHVRTYVVKRKPDYITLIGYANRGIPLHMAASLLAGESAGSCNVRAKVIAGTFQVKTTWQIDAVLSIIDSVHGYNDAVKNNYFIQALSLCLWLPEFNWKSFQKTLKNNYSKLPRLNNVNDFLREIEKIYNFNARRDDVPIAVLAKNAAKKRSAAPKPEAA